MLMPDLAMISDEKLGYNAKFHSLDESDNEF